MPRAPRIDRLAAGGPVHRALEEVFERCDRAARVRTDPVEFVHRYAHEPQDAELVALVASSVAFGNVKALRAKLADALERLGPRPALVADDAAAVRLRLRGWVHRVYTGDDLAGLIVGARRVQLANGSLGAALGRHLRDADGDLREALARFVDAIRREGGLDARAGRGARHLLPDPRGQSGCKRLLLLLRWMVRGPDGVDLGLWREHVDVAALLVPVDVHIHKLAKNLGLTARAGTSFRTTVEITDALRRFDARDPTRFDFALCHMGMAGRCPSERDATRCEGCSVQPVCRHWSSRALTTLRSKRS
jgi:uncharacterized protein (TIGR02757 family)